MRIQVGARIQAAIDAGLFPPGTHADAVFRILLTAIHGAAVMRLTNRSAPGEDVDALARDTLEAALTGLRAGFPLTYQPIPCDHKTD